MEKRLILAFILSFVVFYVWHIFFPPPKPETLKKQITQQVEEKEDRDDREVSFVKESFEVAPEKIEEVTRVQEESQLLENNKVAINLSNRGGSIQGINIKKFNHPLSVSNILAIKGISNSDFALSRKDNDTVEYVYSKNGISIKKSYDLSDNNIIEAQIRVKNTSDMEKALELEFIGFEIVPDEAQNGMNTRYAGMLKEYSVYSGDEVFRKRNATKFSKREAKVIDSKIKWIGYRDRYYCMLIKPNFFL